MRGFRAITISVFHRAVPETFTFLNRAWSLFLLLLTFFPELFHLPTAAKLQGSPSPPPSFILRRCREAAHQKFSKCDLVYQFISTVGSNMGQYFQSGTVSLKGSQVHGSTRTKHNQPGFRRGKTEYE